MKKIFSILLSVILLFSIVIPVSATVQMDQIIVTADSFDNTIYDEYQQVIINSETVDFLAYADSISIDIVGTDKDLIKDVTIIDHHTIIFDMMMYNALEGKYTLVIDYKDGIIPMEQWDTQSIVVKEGHFDFEDDPATVESILTNGITVRFFNKEIESTLVSMIDNVNVDCTKITDRIFKIYPTVDEVLNKDEIEVRLITQTGFYMKTLRIIENEIYLEKETYSREEPLTFYMYSKVIEFPTDPTAFSAIITGRGRYIDISNVVVFNKQKVKLYTPLPLATGTYDMAFSFDGIEETYNLEFEVVRQTFLDNNELDHTVLDFLEVDGRDISLTLYDNQIYRYIDSEKREIDLTAYDFETFSLDFTNQALLILLENNLGLTINFSDYQFILPYEELSEVSEKDVYIYSQKREGLTDTGYMYYPTSKGLYIDSNVDGMKIFTNINSNIKVYEKANVIIKDLYGEKRIKLAYVIGKRLYANYEGTGTYQFFVKANDFSDVSVTYWGNQYIAPLTVVGIINGMGDGTFKPEGEVTRAQFAKLVAVSTMVEAGSNSSFSDVEVSDWYYGYIAGLENEGIVDGTTFYPNEAILRKDMAVMVMKAYENYTGEDLQVLANHSTATFTDINTLTAEEIKYISAAHYLGIINGMTATTYEPDNTATRAQASAIIYRLMLILEML
ncbi:MAG: S-layer homology domain-containing protein [Clostridiales bacterium]|nr:S-layer homology domain-containing protein [Clostridiales bacterium]